MVLLLRLRLASGSLALDIAARILTMKNALDQQNLPLLQQLLKKVHDVLLRYRIVKVEEIARTVGMSTQRIHHILHVELDLSNLSGGYYVY